MRPDKIIYPSIPPSIHFHSGAEAYPLYSWSENQTTFRLDVLKCIVRMHSEREGGILSLNGLYFAPLFLRLQWWDPSDKIVDTRGEQSHQAEDLPSTWQAWVTVAEPKTQVWEEFIEIMEDCLPIPLTSPTVLIPCPLTTVPLSSSYPGIKVG